MDQQAHKVWQSLHEDAATMSPKRYNAQHAAGKKTVRERLAMLLDAHSFEEIDQFVTPLSNDLKLYTDGVITGFGTIHGRRVAIYAQDFTIKGGSLGKKHAEKICKVMDMAAKIGCPIIGLIDSGGARIDEGIHALSGYGSIFMRNIRYSGVVPQISVILGPCAGGAAYSPALTDFIIMTKDISQLFITGPQVIEQVTNQVITKEELGGWEVHSSKSGLAHLIANSEQEAFYTLKKLLTYLPQNYLETTRRIDKIDVQEDFALLAAQLPDNPNQTYDMRNIIFGVIDQNSYCELQPNFAMNIITAFARIDGHAVGIVANQPLIKAGTIDIDASTKAARFIQTCNNFGLPIVSLVDVPGYLPGIEQEHNGIIRHGAKLLYAYAQATVPKITIIIRKAFGGAYIVMGSKELGADFNYAWPTAQIAVLGARAAVTIMQAKYLTTLQSSDRITKQLELEQAYEATFLNPYMAAEHGYIDGIIDPNKTRDHIIKALEITAEKVEHLPRKKQGNCPL
ncbi:acyl-CoA carboxylase subunit beta [Candidatus Dependentiae bacterium]|nr:acyl-CoA carboxylase subunit beta [Candidatus Dependentiae bacterium]